MTMWIRNVQCSIPIGLRIKNWELSIGQFFKALKPATTSADVLY